MAAVLTRTRQILSELNLFRSGLDDEQIVRHERRSTRLYLGLLIIALIVVVMYIGFGIKTVHVTVHQPSLLTYQTLKFKYSETLKCPCTQIAVKYGRFVQTQLIYHQICRSAFITQDWILASFHANSSQIWPMDVRTMISAHAQFLRSVCTNTQRAIEYTLIGLLSSSLISTEVLPVPLVQLQVKILEENLRSASKWQLSVVISFLRLITSSTHFVTGLGGNSFLYIPSNTSVTANIGINVYQLDSQSAPCYCLSVSNCPVPGAIYTVNQWPTFGYYNLETLKNYSIPVKGMQMGCFAMDSALTSTLECYFDEACLNLLVSNASRFPVLSTTVDKHFKPNDTVEYLVDELLVDQWGVDMSFNDYYVECAPNICTYSYNERNDFLIIVTTIISLIGGLNAALRIVVPWIIQILTRLIRRYRPTPDPLQERVAIVWIQERSIFDRIKQKLKFIWSTITLLNLFDSKSTDPLKMKRERYTTRLYLLCLCLAFFILFCYTITTEETKVYTIDNPTQQRYEQLFQQHPLTIECTCKEIGISYSKFVTITANYHQVCTSGFISPSFFTQLAMIRQDLPLYPADFMLISVGYFQWLTTFCALSQVVFPTQLLLFQSKLYVNNKLLARDSFQTQTEQLIDSFINDLYLYFYRGIKQTREMVAFSQPLSATNTITYKLPIKRTSSGLQIQVQPVPISTDCSCVYDPTRCSKDAAFYSYNINNQSFDPIYKITGLRVACSSMESFLQSTLACWYTSDCYNTVIQYWQNRTYGLSNLPPLLTGANLSRYSLSTPLYVMIEKLMVENWSKNVSYESYYAGCAPQYCTYSVTQRRNIVFIITILLGLFGGLNTALKLLAPIFIRSIGSLFSHRREFLASLKHSLVRLPNRLIHLNLFHHPHKSTPVTIQQERHSTRLYLTLILVGMITLIFYQSLVENKTTNSISYPSQRMYENLYESEEISSLQCPCTHVSISYSRFVQVNTSLHEICSSAFIQLPWIQSIFRDGDWSNLTLDSFYGRGVIYFQGLRSMCLLYQENITQYVSHFLSTVLISDRVLSRDQLLTQVNAAVDQAKAASRADQSAMYKFARDLEHSNQMMTVYLTNWAFTPIEFDWTRIGLPIPLTSISYGNCSCSTSTQCSGPLFYQGEPIPGFRISCLPIQSLFQTTLICLYNQTCIDQINIDHLPMSPLMARNQSVSSSINRTVEQLLENALDLEWSVTINYADFYNECEPNSCSYSINSRKDGVQITVTLLGLYGGLAVALRTIVPLIINILLKIFRICRISRVTSES